MGNVSAIRLATPSERVALGELHRRSSFVWEEDRANLEAHPDALGVAREAIAAPTATRTRPVAMASRATPSAPG